MSKRNRGAGRPFVGAVEVAVGVTNLDTLQSGQWIRLAGSKDTARLVRERGTGETFVVSRARGQRLSLAAFRLACGVANPNVLATIK